jgi:hypothetical protein
MTATELIELLKLSEDPDSAWMTELIERGPVNGEGGGCHGWLYKAARGLHLYRRRHGLTKREMFTLLRAKSDGYVRVVSDSEIEETIENAVRDADEPRDEARARQGGFPRPDYKTVDEIVMVGFGIRELKAASPVDLATNPVTCDQVVRRLFPGDGLVCAGSDAASVITKPLSAWLKGEALCNERLSQQTFIVPNRMSKLRGTNKKGEDSPRCADNTGPREYLVIEFDISKLGGDGVTPTPWKPWIEKWEAIGITVADASAALLWHLKQEAGAPLALAVDTRGKSIHGWCICRGVDEGALRLFMEGAAKLGADPATLTRCQLVRMPQGMRGWRKRQEVLYFNPEILKNAVEAA